MRRKTAKRRLMKKVRLSGIPNLAIGEIGEMLVLIKLWELGLDGVLCRKNMKHVDIFAFDPANNSATKKTVAMVPVQVKSISQRKHGKEKEITPDALKEFEGWYIFLIEEKEKKPEDEDTYLYIASGKMKDLMAEYGEPKGKPRYIRFYHHTEIIERHRDPTGFVEAVKRAGAVKFE